MSDETLIQELMRIEHPDNHKCLGCGHEHSCRILGCAIIKQAAGRLEQLTAPAPNAPLTMEELQEMSGEPVWVERKEWKGRWALIRFSNQYCLATHGCGTLAWEDYGKAWFAYRRKPEDGTT